MSSENIGIEEARKRLGDLVTAAQQGADIIITRNGKPAARIVRYEETAMTSDVTTQYGSWNRADPSSLTLADSVATALGGFVGDFDIDGICVDYRAAINESLPDGVSLLGDEFYGPWPHVDVDLRAIVAGVDFWAIAERHDTTATA